MKKEKKSAPYLSRLNASLVKFAGYYLLALLVFTLNRGVLLFRFKPDALFEEYKADLPAVFAAGFRFDSQVILYAGLPLLLAALVLPVFKNGLRIFNRFFIVYTSVVIALMAALLIFDQQYYSFFKTHYDTVVFGLMEDDTQAVLQSVWTDHPVFRITAALTVVVFLIVKVSGRIGKRETVLTDSVPFGVQIAVPFFLLGLTALGLRGSLGTFPLRGYDSTVSESSFLNFLTPNGIFALKEAFRDRNRTFRDFDNEKLLREYGYADEGQALREYYGTDTIGDMDFSLYTTTPSDPFLERNPPNVVFVLMESFSNYYLDLHVPGKFNLLGRLEPHFREDLLFRNFVSGENGTIQSLEGLMFGIPYHPVAQTVYKQTAFPTSVALPYQRAGYETVFVTGTKLGWRDVKTFVPPQGFDKIYGEAAIHRTFGDAEGNIWGAFDEYLFRYVRHLLEEESDRPKFIFVLTTTNHSPYSRPAHYEPYPLILTDSMLEQTGHNPQTYNNFMNYQYSADCLGRFMDTLKTSRLKDHTIVSATGDHNTLMLFQFSRKTLPMKRGVPFYLYAPPAYLTGKKTDTKRFGSHKDIFPTLFNLSLSGQRYFNLGNDLLSRDSSVFYFGVNEHNMAVSENGAVLNYPDRDVIHLEWEGGVGEQLREIPEDQAAGNALLLQKARSYTFLSRYYFNRLFLNDQ